MIKFENIMVYASVLISAVVFCIFFPKSQHRTVEMDTYKEDTIQQHSKKVKYIPKPIVMHKFH